MQILLSSTGTPYIELENGGKLIFSKITADPIRGYRFLCYNNTKTSSVTVSGKNAKRKKTYSVSEDENFTVRLKDFKRDDKKGFPKGIVDKITLSYLKKKVMDLVDDEGYLPYYRIEDLNDTLVQLDADDDVDFDPTMDEEDYEIIKKKPSKTIKSRIKPVKVKSKIKTKIKKGKKK